MGKGRAQEARGKETGRNQNQTTRIILIMIDKFLSKTGVGIALLLMVTELSYVNTLSLEYMFNTQNISATIFGIIGAIAFSSVTVLIMRLGKQNWAKIAFPLFDMLLTFCGLNLEHADHLFANPIRFAMSIILSVFAGLNTYSLGLINADQHSGEAEEQKILESNYKESLMARRELQGELDSLQSNYANLISQHKETFENLKLLKKDNAEIASCCAKLESDYASLKSNYEVNSEHVGELQSKLEQAYAEAAKYKGVALASEAARIRKKAIKNRTPEELELLELIEMVA